MTTQTPDRVITWHEDEIPMMVSAPRPGAGTRALDFADRDRGISFRISSFTQSAADRRERPLFSPRHRHTFDQFRFYISGETQYGSKNSHEVYGAGDCLYIPAGIHYGPMRLPENAADEAYRLFYIQYQGMSGIPYYSSEDLVGARERLESKGKFEEGIFKWNDGHNQDGWEAMLQEELGREVAYPQPAVSNYIAIRTRNLNWTPSVEHAGVSIKSIGHFTEVGPNAMLIHMDAGSVTPAGKAPYQQARCLISGRVRFGEEDRVFGQTTNRYIPPDVPFGATECVEDATILIVKWAADGQGLYAPDLAV
jgi:hypothetical protein